MIVTICTSAFNAATALLWNALQSITINPMRIKGGFFRVPFYMKGACDIIEADADRLSITI